MKVTLAYNSFDSISGETVFFSNMEAGLKARGADTTTISIRQAEPHTLAGSAEHIFRCPLLLNAARELKRSDHDVLHLLNAALSPAAKNAKSRVKLATAHFFIDSYISSTESRNPLVSAAESLYARYVSMLDRSAFHSLDCLVACTAYQASCIREAYGLPPSKIRVIPPGIDTAYFRGLPKMDLRKEYGFPRTILSLGRLHERSKGISYLIRAMKHIKDAGLLVLGDGPDKKMYERMACTEGLANRVRFLGNLGFREKSVIQKSADAVAVPSQYEVFGTVFAESLACGTPVAAFDMPFWKGLYDGAGVLAEPKDPLSLAESLEKAMARDASMESNGRKLADKYSLENTISAYLSLYRELYESS